MREYLSKEAAMRYAIENDNILPGYTLDSEYSILLCERGKEYFYTKKRTERKEDLSELRRRGRRRT